VDFFETWSPTGDENWPKKLPLLAAVYWLLRGQMC
jgi:hypothetical protein